MKYRKSFNTSPRQRHQPSIDYPDVANMDDIAVLTDEELVEAISRLDVERRKVLSERCDAKDWEIELCYLRREMQIRRKRRETHDSFMESLSAEDKELRKLEKTLPVADFDNTVFMVRT